MDVPNEILHRYVRGRKMDLEKCLKYVSEGKYGEIEKVGHQLKGNGVTFGFPELTQIGNKLETAARESDEGDLSSALRDLSCWVSRFN
jgi:HPt (histidine-containing phosphotransfer) domain-containing protein